MQEIFRQNAHMQMVRSIDILVEYVVFTVGKPSFLSSSWFNETLYLFAIIPSYSIDLEWALYRRDMEVIIVLIFCLDHVIEELEGLDQG